MVGKFMEVRVRAVMFAPYIRTYVALWYPSLPSKSAKEEIEA